MYSLLLPSDQRTLLRGLLGCRVRQLVWDLNAVYFVGAPEATQTVKLECAADRPPASDAAEYDEAVYLVAELAPDAGPFHRDGEAGYWYRVVAEEARIER